MTTISTIGHSNKGADEFVALVVEHDLDTIVDVRTSPYSRYNPQFNRENLKAALEAAGVRYDYRGKNLGGMGENVQFDETIRELVERARAGERLAVMCSEGSHRNCHRGDDLANAFLSYDNVDVRHVQWKGAPVVVHGSPRGATPPPRFQPPQTLAMF
jgi:uncharacterized protein (DUF488 family)